MLHPDRLLEYFQKGIDTLIKAGHFENGLPYRPTQAEALEAYKKYLADEGLTPAQRLKGYFEIPTGIGKTALFIAILAAANQAAMEDAQELKTVIVEPTTQLLGQTHKSFKSYAHALHNQIGHYGDGHKNLSQPITIMTYVAWAELTQAGVIGSHNVDILIADEAHRGTSENRITSIKDYFNETVAQIAFTATAHFDEEKSVQASHEREIYYKPFPDAVREGELCSYIQTQNHEAEIEIPDDLKELFNECTPEIKTAYRKKLRQTVWNKTAHALFRDGKDERTGEPLSDNKAGFFVEGTDQADELEDMLNADPVLQAKAKELGCEYVGLAIHSKLSPKEQKRRHKLYEDGKVMAIIGDEQFKEGSDYPHMKTIFDTKHGSLVDKMQIIGRGARWWLNPAKGNRDEGLTFVDIITYFQGENDDETEQNREAALRSSIRAKDILQGDYVLSEKEEEFFRKPGKSGGFGGVAVHVDGAAIKSYTTLESLYELSREISELRKEDWIEITDEMRAELQYEMTRTQVKPANLLIDSDIEDTSPVSVSRWKLGVIQTVDLKVWDAVLKAYKNLPDSTRIPFTVDMRNQLLQEVKRTNVGAIVILKLVPDAPEGLTVGIIESLKFGREAVSVEKEYWDWLSQGYASLQDSNNKKILITDEMRTLLISEAERTGVKSVNILKTATPPDGLTYKMINSWKDGKVKFLHEPFWDWVIAQYKVLPDAETRIVITDIMRQELQQEIIRTNIGSEALLKHKIVIDGLLPATIDNWAKGKKADTANKRCWDLVIETYRSLPTVIQRPRINLSEEHRLKLSHAFERTGIGSRTLIKLLPSNLNDITPNLVDSWRLNQKIVTADEEYWNAVINLYDSLPTKDI